MWLVPNHLEYYPVQVPTVVTGFGKSSEVPDDLTTLMELDTDQEIVRGDRTLNVFLERLLTFGPDWTYGSPAEQQRKLDFEEKQRAAAARTEAAQQDKYARMVEELNRNSASPVAAYGTNCIETEDGPFVWATLSQCWKCSHPMLLWEARGPRPGKRFVTVPALKVKSVDRHPYPALGQAAIPHLAIAQTAASGTRGAIRALWAEQSTAILPEPLWLQCELPNQLLPLSPCIPT